MDIPKAAKPQQNCDGIAENRLTAIVATLRAEIISGVLAPDQPLGQDRLAERFNVSRIPVREALFQLQGLGFVTIEPNKRARVAPVSLADFLEIYDMRIAAETLALRRAIPELSDAMIAAASGLQDQIEAEPVENFGALNTAFHMEIYRAAKSPRLLAHIQVLGNAADRYQCMAKAGPEARAKSDGEHWELLAACGNRDGGSALACLRRHIEAGRDMLAPIVSQQV